MGDKEKVTIPYNGVPNQILDKCATFYDAG